MVSSDGNPRIALIGAGPVGSMLAAGLLTNGHSFDWVVREEARRRQLGCLKLQHDSSEEELSLESVVILEAVAELGHIGLIILAVKAQQVEPLLSGLQLPNPVQILAVANGLQQGPFQLGLLYGGAYLDKGTVVAAHSNRLKIGPVGMQADLSSSQELCDMLGSSYMACEASVAMVVNMWHKLALNCVVNPWTAILDCPNGRLLEVLQADQFLVLLTEVSQTACADIEVKYSAMPALVREAHRALSPRKLYSDCLALIRSTAGNSSSMREDLLHGRETEIGALNCAVVRVAESHGLACPANRELAEKLMLQANRQHA